MKTISILIVAITTVSLTSCATTYNRGDGVVIAEKKLKEHDYKPHQNTQTGALLGGSIGGISGAVGGAVLGLGVGVLVTSTAPALAAVTLGGAVIGAAIYGTAGGVIGGGIGYAIDVTSPGAGFYEFVVKSQNELKPMIISQYTTPIPVHAVVHILEKNNVIFIKPKD